MKEYRNLMMFSAGFHSKRVHARAIFAYPVDAPAVQLYYTLVAGANIEDAGEAAVLLLKGDDLVAMHGFPSLVGNAVQEKTRTPAAT
jgi:hypothetical protein